MVIQKKFNFLNIEKSSYVDPNGFVFLCDGQIFRAIHEHAKDFYMDLFKKGVIDKLVKRGHLVASEIVNAPYDVLFSKLVLKHKRIYPVSYCVEWCPSMLKDAALATINLSLELVRDNCQLQDAYPWNILFDGTKAVHIDFTSITPTDGRLIWGAYEQYQSFFERPLQLANVGKGQIARALAFNNISGITLELFDQNVGAFYKSLHPSMFIKSKIDKSIQSNHHVKNKLKRFIDEKNVLITPQIRERFFQGLLRKTEKIFVNSANKVWQDYYEEIPDYIVTEKKKRNVTQIISQVVPRSVLDIGTNTGCFAVEAAKYGAQVIALDSNEACIEHLYRLAKEQHLNILPLVVDIVCPTPQFGFMGEQYPSIFERVKQCDLVLCLGLMHHLHIACRQSFTRIAELLARMSGKFLIFEYIDKDDANNVRIESNRVIDYSRKMVVEALSSFFEEFTYFPSDRPTRELILCRKKKIILR